MQNILERINQLSPEIRREVEDFVEFLITKQSIKKKKSPTFGWAGAMKDLREKYTSVELQHKISEWRIGEK